MSVSLEAEEDVQVAPLSADEMAWLKKLDALLGKMPPRLKLIEVDDSLQVVDREAATTALDSSNKAGFATLREAGVVLASVGNGLLKISGMTC